MKGQHHNEDKEAGHHDLCNPFHPVVKAQAAHQKPQEYGEGHEDAHFPGTSQHGGKDLRYLILGHAAEGAGEKFPEIGHHPAGYGGVVHHEEVASKNAEPAMNVPKAPRFFKAPVGTDGALPAAPAYCQFHGHHGDAHEKKEAEVKKDKYGTAVFSGNIGEFPHIPYADGTAGADQKEAQPGFKTISIFHTSLLII